MQVYSSLFNFHNNRDVSFKAKPIPSKVAENMKEKMLNADRITIFCHSAPDEDTLNSAKVIAEWLISAGKKVRIIAEGSLKGLLVNKADEQIIYNPNKLKESGKSDLAIVVDCNSKLRLSENANKILKKYKKNEITGFDHHEEAKNVDLIGDINLESKSPFYLDKEAQSCCALVFRFFEWLGIKLNQDILSNLYCGMADDLIKSGCITVEKDNNTYKTVKSGKIDKYTADVLDKIEKQLSDSKRKEILEHLDILSHLTPDETKFRKKIFRKKIKFTKNGKLAYAVINPNDKEWKNIGAENAVTVKILSDFRQRLLKNNLDDPFIPKGLHNRLSRIEGVAVFFPGPKESVTYKFNILSHDNYAKKLSNEMNILYPKLNSGGHSNRVGGKIYSNSPKICKKLAKNLINIANGKLRVEQFKESVTITS